MKLFASLLTTTIIAGTIWGAVVMQPVMAENSLNTEVSKTAEKTPTKLQVAQQAQDKSKAYIRSVVSQSISLDAVAALWLELEGEGNGMA